MRVIIRLFARLRDIAGTPELEREIEPGTTVRAVWERLVGDFPAMAPYGRSISSAVNAEYSSMSATIHDGDEIAFLPPVSGGTASGSDASGA